MNEQREEEVMKAPMQEKAPAFDAASIAPSADFAEVEIYDSVRKMDTGIRITVYSKDSETHKKISRKQTNRRFKGMGRRVNMTLTAEELENEELELLVGCTKGWADMNWSGKPLDCTPENVLMVYRKVPMIREQVSDAINDRTNFLPR